jgi:hypothetical protein
MIQILYIEAVLTSTAEARRRKAWAEVSDPNYHKFCI